MIATLPRQHFSIRISIAAATSTRPGHSGGGSFRCGPTHFESALILAFAFFACELSGLSFMTSL